MADKTWVDRLGGGMWEVIRRTVSLAGTVTDAATDRPAHNAGVVAVSDSVTRLATTSFDGRFFFLDLPGGTYRLFITKALCPRAVQWQIEVVVFGNVPSNIGKTLQGEYKAAVFPIEGGEDVTAGLASSAQTDTLVVTVRP